MMTELENTDNIEYNENVTVTSDAAFERVTSDLKMEEWQKEWYLQQNTAWLTQEIPNISFLDIADTFLVTKKTLADKAWYVLVVWTDGKSIEAVPYSDLPLI